MFNRRERSEFAEISAIIRDAIHPIGSQMRTLEEKVDKLSQDRVTRSDVEKLRSEMVSLFVPRDSYEPRHAALIDRYTQIEGNIREVRRDLEERVKGFDARFTQGSQSIQQYLQGLDLKIDSHKKTIEDDVETKFKDHMQTQLSAKDRAWLRGTQILSFVVGGIGLIDIILRLLHIG